MTPTARHTADARRIARDLVREHGRTYAEEAGVRLADEPAPLYQLLVVSTLLSARITASVATAAGRELFAAGFTTPGAMVDASWQDRVDALGRGHYRRYDERTATMLGDGAQQCLDRWQGDLRALHEDAGDDLAALRERLTAFPGIGPAGADIFLREVQSVWTSVPVFVDAKVRDGAERSGLAADDLAGLVGPGERAALWAALVRISLER